MSTMNVNVSVEKLELIKDYVDNFKKNVNAACFELESATSKLKQNNSAGDIQTILNSVEDVEQIILDAAPTLNELKEKIEIYIRIVNRLKEIARR